jgi:hypothetical protein
MVNTYFETVLSKLVRAVKFNALIQTITETGLTAENWYKPILDQAGHTYRNNKQNFLDGISLFCEYLDIKDDVGNLLFLGELSLVTDVDGKLMASVAHVHNHATWTEGEFIFALEFLRDNPDASVSDAFIFFSSIQQVVPLKSKTKSK